MRPSLGLAGLLLLLAPAVLAQGVPDDTKTVAIATTTADENTGETSKETATTTENKEQTDDTATAVTTEAPATTDATDATTSEILPSNTQSKVVISNAPKIAGYGTPDMVVPDTANAPFMQKSNLPDGTVFICVGAALGFFGAAILAWRGLVAWSLRRSVKRAALAQNVADMKAMTANPAKSRGLYNFVASSSNMSLDRLSAAPTGISRPFAATTNSGTPPKLNASLFFSPTAGGAAGLRDSANRSSSYLPAGYYPSGSAQPAQGSPTTHVGGAHHAAHLSTSSLTTPGNRLSHLSGVSPPASPSLPPSRGYDGISTYNRNSVATLGTPATRGGVYAGDSGNMSQLSLNVPGGTNAPGGRAPSAYLEDLFESHRSGPQERF